MDQLGGLERLQHLVTPGAKPLLIGLVYGPEPDVELAADELERDVYLAEGLRLDDEAGHTLGTEAGGAKLRLEGPRDHGR